LVSPKKHFRFYFADIGPTVAWGNAPNPSLPKIAYNYQVATLSLQLQPFDVYLVDGRFRVSCVCLSFLHALKYRADMDHVRVAVHDFPRRLKSYGQILNIC
jgi:hypothetical protein